MDISVPTHTPSCPHHGDSDTPPVCLTSVGLNMFVDTTKLRELPLPLSSIPIASLLWHFDMPVWSRDGTCGWNLTPWQVLRKEEGSTDHQMRLDAASLEFPIVVSEYGGRLVILDGVHRTAKAYKEGKTHVEAKVIPVEYLSRSEFQS